MSWDTLRPISFIVACCLLLLTIVGSEASKPLIASHKQLHAVGRRLLEPQGMPHRKPTFGVKTCMAEEQCISEFCGKGYEHTANKFPYTIDYDKTSQPDSTTFIFQVCNKWCDEQAEFCEALAAWTLRLDTELVRNGHFIAGADPGGRLISKCEETGLGYRWEADQLRSLHEHIPWAGDRCVNFTMTVRHDEHMTGNFWLTDICQQNIDIVATKNGKTMFAQTSMVVTKDKYSDVGSCLVHFQTKSGTYGFTLLEDKEFSLRDRRPPENAPADIKPDHLPET
ncbi:hypothetical protein WJX72_002040 [[Myrmecia] bisecta]|uniref:Uncharacterized protein n=1 Tax=[Myrmecia] bisecta TaxID=41462 RepID=A0AAW1PZH0_9CHLO